MASRVRSSRAKDGRTEWSYSLLNMYCLPDGEPTAIIEGVRVERRDPPERDIEHLLRFTLDPMAAIEERTRRTIAVIERNPDIPAEMAQSIAFDEWLRELDEESRR